jgi:short-subunit dehydrogenase
MTTSDSPFPCTLAPVPDSLAPDSLALDAPAPSVLPGRVLILGAWSDIGRAVAREFASRGYALQLAARQVERLEEDARHLRIAHRVEVTLHEFDALDLAHHAGFVAALPALPSVVVCAVGLLGDQTQAEQDALAADLVLRSNFNGPVSILGVCAAWFEEAGMGTLIGISSVAGERGRASNYVYGSAKAGFTAFLSGLRNRLSRRGVRVITVKPGFVRTRMTEHLKLPSPLTAEPEEVARAIVRACQGKAEIVYIRPIWFLIMLIIRHIPERIFKRLSL